MLHHCSAVLTGCPKQFPGDVSVSPTLRLEYCMVLPREITFLQFWPFLYCPCPPGIFLNSFDLKSSLHANPSPKSQVLYHPTRTV